MNARQKRFVEEYLIDLNATQAAIRAGYSKNRANAIGYDLLTNTDIQSAINSALAERAEKTKITAEYVLGNLKEVVERSLQRAPVFAAKGQQAQDDEGRDVWEFNASGANKALELLGRHLGMFKDRVEIEKPLEPPKFEIRFVGSAEETPQDVIDGAQ
jgi:phage terminase small subunit